MEKIIPKCKDDNMRFMGADGNIYPCCFIYTDKDRTFDPWIEKNGEDILQLNYKNYTLKEILNSNIFKKLENTFKNFEKCLEPCQRNCGSKQGYESVSDGSPKWKKYE